MHSDRLSRPRTPLCRDPKLTGDASPSSTSAPALAASRFALAKELPAAKIYATDIPQPPFKIAQRNATRLGFSNRIHLPRIQPARGIRTFSQPVTRIRSYNFQSPYIGRKESTTLPVESATTNQPTPCTDGEERLRTLPACWFRKRRAISTHRLLVLELGHDSLPAVRPLFESPEWKNLLVTNDLAAIPASSPPNALPRSGDFQVAASILFICHFSMYRWLLNHAFCLARFF